MVSWKSSLSVHLKKMSEAFKEAEGAQVPLFTQVEME